MLYFVVFVVGIALLIGAMRKGSSTMEKPSKIEVLTSKLDADKVMKVIIDFAQKNDYTIDDFNEETRVIVLSQPATLTTNGFFFPIYIKDTEEKLTIIEVGIKSKVVQVGPIVNRTHEKCFNGIKSALFAAS